MKNKYVTSINDDVAIRKFENSDANYLLNAGFPSGRKELEYSLKTRISESLKLIPRRTRIVAHHIKTKRVIGFLSLFEHTPVLYSIKHVFTDPTFRKKGIATGLFNFALNLAKKQGAKKVFLNVSSDNLNFYNKFGFELVSDVSVIWAGGFPQKFGKKSYDTFFSLNANKQKNKDLFFSIYQNCLGTKWINFFETNPSNLIDGFSRDFHRLYLRTFFINESADSLLMIFKRPLNRYVSAEMYLSLDSNLPSILYGLFKILNNKGIIFAQLKIFSKNEKISSKIFEEMDLHPYQSKIVGKSV